MALQPVRFRSTARQHARQLQAGVPLHPARLEVQHGLPDQGCEPDRCLKSPYLTARQWSPARREIQETRTKDDPLDYLMAPNLQGRA